MLFHLSDNVVERAPLALVERVFRVTISAAQIAARQANEDARLPRIGALALDAVENLIDRERIGSRLGLRRGFDFGAHRESLAENGSDSILQHPAQKAFGHGGL